MNSRQRRTTERYWPHAVFLHHGGHLVEDCYVWLNETLGTSQFNRRRPPRWCFRAEYQTGPDFSRYLKGMSVFFRYEKDYVAFLLKWDR